MSKRKKDSPSKIDVWMPLYIADYLADTNRLTTVQHGAYLLLIMDYWRNGALPDDDNVLAQVVKLTVSEWLAMRDVISRFFEIHGSIWIHKRIEAELETAIINSITAHKKAKAGAAARWKDHIKNA